MKKIWEKFVSIALVGALAFGLSCSWEVPAHAATFTQINQASVFLKQPKSGECTLTSATMMVRRAAMLNGNSDWMKLDVDAMRSIAWVTGQGLKWSFSTSGVSVGHSSFSGKSTDLINLLNAHPEGIMIYDRGLPHAILVTDYTGGVFYAADPANNIEAGRIPITKASVTIAASDDIWYVTSTVKGLSGVEDLALVTSAEKVQANTSPTVTQKPAATAKPTATPEPTKSSVETTVVKPKQVSKLAVKNAKKKALATSWQSVTGAKGYQVTYSTSKKFSKKSTIISEDKSKTIAKLSKGKTYYVKVRAYKVDDDKRVYGKYSSVKKAKVKK